MQIDKITYDDLSIFSDDEESSIFHKLNFTRTVGGRDRLFQYFNHPFSNLKHITETQKIIQLILANVDEWPLTISNGTIMVIERFYETALDEIPSHPNIVNATAYKLLHGPDYSLLRYSLSHFADFTKGMEKLVNLFDNDGCPSMLRSYLHRIKFLLRSDVIRSLNELEKSTPFSVTQTAYYGHFIREQFKNSALELIDIYSRLDAWYSMAMATQKFNMVLPTFVETPGPSLDMQSLYHILLSNPVSYNVHMVHESNFVFLTGANMAGKSTFIKAVGAAVFMAHLGMGVPAASMKLSLFDGVLSNINVVDNLVKGESYFFNEVQRIKNTLIKITDNRTWLVLIDELFKGTNVQDAMKCSSTVIKGLIKIKNSVFILSTHLYEIADELKQYSNISFKYFETSIQNDQLEFSYQLKEGISNDRLGYLILKREDVVDMLEKL